MGFDIAQSAANLGASVILVTGPSHLKIENNVVKVIRVVSAQEMYDACHQYFDNVDVMIAAAAVADYKPKTAYLQKIKKDADVFTIELEKTKDILASLGEIKKNQFLSKIKSDLKKSSSSDQIFPVIKMIDRNLNNKDDWKFFEEAFNNADKDFLKKVKSTHPSLTNNDLRLCAYLRLNLSSKDIAPLLNISLSSVEIKRYRLRKKMQLTHNEGLTDHLLSL